MTTARTIPPLRSLSADRWMLPIIKTVMQLKQKSNIAMAKPNVMGSRSRGVEKRARQLHGRLAVEPRCVPIQ
jgi:hypothetical protein